MAYIKQEFIDRVLQDADIIDIFNNNEDSVVKKGLKVEKRRQRCLLEFRLKNKYE